MQVSESCLIAVARQHPPLWEREKYHSLSLRVGERALI
jgi:hypothetical protein